MKPKISVIMSLYNTPEKWLREAVESVLNQTYDDFEFIIYEDCPTDNSEAIIDEYVEKDSRIIVVKNEQNKGLTRNLNEAVVTARGEYIARMDSDDICELNRFEKQVKFMDINRNVAVVGSYINVFSGNNKNAIGMINLDKSMEVTRVRMMFSNSGVAHPTAFIRKSFLVSNNLNYRCEYKKSQDYGLWNDIISHNGIIRVIPEILLNYRVHNDQISVKNKVEQNECAKKIILSQINNLIDDPGEDILKIHNAIYSFDSSLPLSMYVDYIKLLIKQNKYKRVFNEKVFKKELLSMWNKNLIKALAHFKLKYLLCMFSIRALGLDIFLYNLRKRYKCRKYESILKNFLSKKTKKEYNN